MPGGCPALNAIATAEMRKWMKSKLLGMISGMFSVTEPRKLRRDYEVFAKMQRLTMTLQGLGQDLHYCRQLTEAIIDAATDMWGGDHNHVLQNKSRLSELHRELGDYDRAMALQQEVSQARRRQNVSRDLEFKTGDVVQIVGLVGAVQHNGQRSIVSGFKPDSGRFVVVPLVPDSGNEPVPGKRSMAIKPANLKLIQAASEPRCHSSADSDMDGTRQEQISGDVEKGEQILIERSARANLLGAQGKFDEAAALFMQNVDLCKRLYGSLHEHTTNQIMSAANMHIYPGLQGNVAHLNEARKLLELAVDQNTQIFGAGHARTLQTKASLAGAIRRTAQRGTARDLLEEVVEGLTTQLGRSHQDTIGELGELHVSSRIS
jgi:tetratricopeptide (TPR) repeat protein